MKIEILYKKFYVDRELYVLKINGKNTMVYKSSGLAGHNSKGHILPFHFLNTCKPRGLGSTPVGYIYKEYIYDETLMDYHSKVYDSFPGKMPEILKVIEEFLKEPLKKDMSEDDFTNKSKFLEIVEDINKNLLTLCANKNDMLDWKTI